MVDPFTALVGGVGTGAYVHASEINLLYIRTWVIRRVPAPKCQLCRRQISSHHSLDKVR
jgi:hypothetical protein